jgi:hypothetical protein
VISQFRLLALHAAALAVQRLELVRLVAQQVRLNWNYSAGRPWDWVSWVAGDEVYGESPALQDAMAARGRWYVLGVRTVMPVWSERPPVVEPGPQERGRLRTKVRLAKGAPPATIVKEVAARWPEHRWQMEMWIKGSKSIFTLDGLRARDSHLAQIYLPGKLLGALLIDLLTPKAVTRVPDWFATCDRPPSPWRLATLLWEHLQSIVRGPVSQVRLILLLPRLQRFLCDPPRKRRQ